MIPFPSKVQVQPLCLSRYLRLSSEPTSTLLSLSTTYKFTTPLHSLSVSLYSKLLNYPSYTPLSLSLSFSLHEHKPSQILTLIIRERKPKKKKKNPMDPNTQRAESDRWLGIAAKLLTARDFLGSRTFAIRARESDPNNSVSDQILAVVDTLLSGEKRVQTNQQPDWYSVLQLPPLVRDPDLISSHYRRLALLLSPDRNRLPFADYALQLVMDAWSVLSDPTKKWLFDNELALSLQRANSEPQVQPHRVEPVRVDPIRVDPATVAAMAAASTASVQLNTFEFFQPQPPPPQSQPTLQMWQQQPQPPPPQQLIQREFMPPPQPPPPQPQLPPQWQMRDSNKGPASRPPGVVAATSAPPRALPVSVPVPNPTPTPAPTEKAMEGNRVVVEEGNAGTDSTHDNCDNVGNQNNEMLESFWTACPYCFYIYEYQKEYQECTLRCQNCRRGFHALPVPNPPPIGPDNGGGRGKGTKEESFCCWGFFPLGFSMPAWKKQNRNGSGNWVPFSPMFASPVGGNFHWFANNGTSVGLKNNVGGRGGLGNGYGSASAPRVYIDDEEDLLDVSDSSGGDSSDRDWRNPGTNKKRKKYRKGKFGGGKRGRPRKVDKISQGNQDSAGGVGVSVGRDDVEDGFEGQEVVVGLVAGVKTDANKNVGSTVMRKQTRRSMKDMGRLDLNVEFNNEGDEHAPTVSAVNGEEDGIENIGFFEGLDEFLSTLPILNVGGDEKAKPS